MTTSRRVTICLFAIVGAGLVAGCTGVQQYDVSGTVTFKNEPIREGTIVFESTNPNVVGGSGPIKDGKFNFKCPAGDMRVMIYATRESGKFDPAMGAAPREQYLPAKFNTESKLTAQVKSSGANEFDFPLTDK